MAGGTGEREKKEGSKTKEEKSWRVGIIRIVEKIGKGRC